MIYVSQLFTEVLKIMPKKQGVFWVNISDDYMGKTAVFLLFIDEFFENFVAI